MTDFNVTFDEDQLNITFAEQGTQGPAGQDADAVPFSLTDTYSAGQLVRTANFTLYISLIDNNLGNPLTDTDSWRVVTATQVIDQLGELTDVTITDPAKDQILVYSGTQWVNQNNHGGNVPVDNSRLGVAVSPTTITEGASDTTVTVTLSIQNMISGETISSQSVIVKNPLNQDVTVTQDDSNANVFSFTANGDNVGLYHISAAAKFTVASDVASHTASATLPVNQPWYSALTATQPTAITSMSTEGVFHSPETLTVTGGGNSGNNVRTSYVALPYASAQTYQFKLGVFASTTTDLGTISTDFRLFRLDDVDDTQTGTFIITIEED